MMIEDLKSRYLERYRESPILTVFLTLMGLSLFITMILSAVSRDYFLSVLGKMSQHVFMDYFWSVSDSINLPYSELNVIYPPLAVCIYSIIGRYTLPFVDATTGDRYLDMYNSQIPMMVFILLTGAGIFLLLTLVRRTIPRETSENGTLLLLFLMLFSFPMIIAVQNGNNIIYVTFFVLLFMLTYRSENKWMRYVSYVSLGMAAGFKFLPAILGLLILRDRRYTEFLACVVIVFALTVVPVVFTDGTIMSILDNIRSLPIDAGGSVNNISKLFTYFGDMYNLSWLETVGFVLLVTVTVLTAVVFALDREMKTWKLMALAACLFVLGPGVGTPYLYIYFIPAAALMIASEKEATRENLISVILITLPLMLFTMDLMHLKIIANFVLMFWLLYEGISDILIPKPGKEKL